MWGSDIFWRWVHILKFILICTLSHFSCGKPKKGIRQPFHVILGTGTLYFLSCLCCIVSLHCVISSYLGCCWQIFFQNKEGGKIGGHFSKKCLVAKATPMLLESVCEMLMDWNIAKSWVTCQLHRLLCVWENMFLNRLIPNCRYKGKAYIQYLGWTSFW